MTFIYALVNLPHHKKQKNCAGIGHLNTKTHLWHSFFSSFVCYFVDEAFNSGSIYQILNKSIFFVIVIIFSAVWFSSIPPNRKFGIEIVKIKYIVCGVNLIESLMTFNLCIARILQNIENPYKSHL